MKGGGICWTIKMGTGKSSGKQGSSCASASGPPVDAPTTTISTRRTFWNPLDGVRKPPEDDVDNELDVRGGTCALDVGSGTCAPSEEHIRIFGSRSSRMTFKASERPADSAGF